MNRWAEVDQYICDLLIPQDHMLEAALAASDAAGLPSIAVTPPQGRLLYLLAKIQGARSILEFGTLGGYSTLWLARALPEGGRVTTLEADRKHAEVARANFTRAGLDGCIDLRLGRALETLPNLSGPFDLIFIDADKPAMPDYFEWSLKLSRTGTVIVADNVVRNGALADADSTDPAVQGVRKFHELVAAEPRVTATTLQTVGSKGYDGFTLVVVNR